MLMLHGLRTRLWTEVHTKLDADCMAENINKLCHTFELDPPYNLSPRDICGLRLLARSRKTRAGHWTISLSKSYSTYRVLQYSTVNSRQGGIQLPVQNDSWPQQIRCYQSVRDKSTQLDHHGLSKHPRLHVIRTKLPVKVRFAWILTAGKISQGRREICITSRTSS